jgi:arylsulfatase
MGYSDIGCMGSEINTPHIDKLADNGMLYTEMHNTAKCYSTRVSLLSGVYYQQSNRAFDNTVTIGELLQENGYRTLWSGKHHASFDPRTRGFDRFYGFLGGAINYINPGDAASLGGKTPAYIRAEAYKWVLDEEGIVQPFIPKQKDYYSTDAFTDYAIKWMDEYQDEDNPFFLYLAYNAPHWPLHAKQEDIEKYEGYYDLGYNAIREKRYQKMLDLGIIDRETSPLSEAVYEQSWEALSEEGREKEIMRMQIYAAMIDRLDQNIGRVIEKLEANDELDNTVIFFLSDNGACAENPQKRVVFPNGKEGKMGEVDSYESIRRSWATVANTPLRWWKLSSYAGGIRTPMIVYCGKNIKSQIGINHQPLHLIDLMPTIMSLTNSETTKDQDYVNALQGIDISPTLQGKKVQREVPLYFQFGGGKAIIDANMKLVKQGKSNSTKWELFNLDKDKTETNDLSVQFSDLYNKMADKWEKWFNQ